MTIGSFSRNQQTLEQLPAPNAALTGLTGYLGSKSWTGGDWPKTPFNRPTRPLAYAPLSQSPSLKEIKDCIDRARALQRSRELSYVPKTSRERAAPNTVVVSTKTVRKYRRFLKKAKLLPLAMAARNNPAVFARYVSLSLLNAGRSSSAASKASHDIVLRTLTVDVQPVRAGTRAPKRRIPCVSKLSAKQKVYRPYVRPPRRSRTEEHGYSMSFSQRDDFLWQTIHPILGTPTASGTTNGQSISTNGIVWTISHDNALLDRLRTKVAGSDFNLGVFLGEGHQAVRMIGHAATSIAASLVLLKVGRFNEAARVLSGASSSRHGIYVPPTRHNASWDKLLSSKWLEMMYGWLPLLKDVEAGAQFLAHHLSVPLQHTVRSSVSAYGVPKTTSPGSSFFIGANSVRSDRLKATLREKNVVQLVGLTDPLSVLWELTPWSFVIDWFVPVGSYLQNRGLSQALTGTFVTSSFVRYHVRGYDFYTPTLWSIDGNRRFFMKGGSLTRTVSSSLTVPSPNIKPLEKVASWRHAANAVALLSQQGLNFGDLIRKSHK